MPQASRPPHLWLGPAPPLSPDDPSTERTCPELGRPQGWGCHAWPLTSCGTGLMINHSSSWHLLEPACGCLSPLRPQAPVEAQLRPWCLCVPLRPGRSCFVWLPTPWCDGAAGKQEWGLCPFSWNLVAAIPSLKDGSRVPTVAKNCARCCVSSRERERQALPSQGLHYRVLVLNPACSNHPGAFLNAGAQAPPGSTEISLWACQSPVLGKPCWVILLFFFQFSGVFLKFI